MKKERQKSDKEEKEVLCVRIKRPLSVRKHKTCPYCFGKISDIKSKKHKKFCDYKEGKDSVGFGFPFD
ncbi:MAG TPA: hypothetical protein VMW81_02795 [Nitrospinota bacterium]|nr:hypothetical protein [Nitrospinota bacterium]